MAANNMGRLKLLITNIGFFGGLKILTSIAPLFLFPYITNQLGSSDVFGTYDLFIVIGSLLCSISMLGIQDAMFREYHYDKNQLYRKKVITTGFIIVFVATVIMSILFIFFRNKVLDLINDQYLSTVFYLVVFYLFGQNLMHVSIHPSRLVNNKKHLFFNSIFFIVLFYGFTLIYLKFIGPSILSLIYAHLVSGLIIGAIFLFFNRTNFFPIKFNMQIARNLLAIGLPLMPIFLIYWANSSIARILIVKYLGTSELGIFAIGSKYASISAFIQSAFAGGWSYFTFATMKDTDQREIKLKIFNVLLIAIVLLYSYLIPVSPWFFKTFFTGNFTEGYVVFSQLFLSPLFLMLYQIIANQFTIVKKSYFSLISLGIGVGIGILMCVFVLQNNMGIREVSYTIPIGYFISLIIASFISKKIGVFSINWKSLMSLSLIVVVNFIFLKTSGFKAYYYIIPLTLFYLILNLSECKDVWKIAYNLIKR